MEVALERFKQGVSTILEVKIAQQSLEIPITGLYRRVII